MSEPDNKDLPSEQSFCEQLKSADNADPENDSLEEDIPLVIDTNEDLPEKCDKKESKSAPDDTVKDSNETKKEEEEKTIVEKSSNGLAESDNSTDSILKKLKCSCCDNKIDLYLQSMALHPVLKVALCESCSLYYNNWEFIRDTDDKDNQCRWCARGGNLIVCDTCHNSFCKECVERNLGSEHLQTILDLDDDVTWSCYVCNDKPLAELQEMGRAGMKVNEELEKKLPAKKTNGSLSAQSSLTKIDKSLTDSFCRKNFTTRQLLDHVEQVKPKRFLSLLEATKSCLGEMVSCVEEAVETFTALTTPGEQTAYLNTFKGQYRYFLFHKLGRFSRIDQEDVHGDDMEEDAPPISPGKLQRTTSQAGKRGGRKSRPTAASSEEDEKEVDSRKRGGRAHGQKRKAESESESSVSDQSDSEDEYSPRHSKKGRRGSGSLKKRSSVGGRGRKQRKKVEDSEEEDEGSDGDWKPKKKSKTRPSLNRSKSGSGGKRGRSKKRGGVNRSLSEEADGEGKESRPKRNVDRRSMAELDSDADMNHEEENVKESEDSKEEIAVAN